MHRCLFLALASFGLAFAQGSPATGWRRVDRPPVQSADPEPVDRSGAFGQPSAQPERPPYGLPPEVTLRPGTYLTVRIAQTLSSDRNQPGDTFAGSLAQPVVVDGVVVAQRNQMVYGRVAEAARARSDRPSRLGLELTMLTLVDGAQLPIRSQLASRQGGTNPTDEQAGTVAATAGAGAVIGAAAGWGKGAAIGAGVGAMAGVVGVMLTRNRPTVVYPEAVLTFAVEDPATISTVRAPQAFRFVGPEDYTEAPPVNAELHRRPLPPPPPYYVYPYPYPYYYGGVSVIVGPRWGYGRWGHRRW